MKSLLLKNFCCLFLLVLLITGCLGNLNSGQRFSGSNLKSTEVSDHFAVFLVRGLRTADAMKLKLEEVPVESQPVFTDKDLISYKWKEHELELRKDYDLNKSLGKVPLDGLPFVVFANGKRIYLGAFWTPLSSLASIIPAIMVMVPMMPQQTTIRIGAGYPDKMPNGQIDPRNDNLIYNALKSTGKLEE